MAEKKVETRIINENEEPAPEKSSPEQVKTPTIEEYSPGEIHEGEITGITSFGAFVKLPNTIEGLVHISEVADTYVANVEQFLQLGQKVKVKILGKNKKGKYDLSIKQVEENKTAASAQYNPIMSGAAKHGKRDKNFEAGSFEDIMDGFLKKSEDIQLDVRRNMQYKQGVKKKGKKKNKPATGGAK